MRSRIHIQPCLTFGSGLDDTMAVDLDEDEHEDRTSSHLDGDDGEHKGELLVLPSLIVVRGTATLQVLPCQAK